MTKEVEARKDDLLEDLQNLLRINSERDDAQATPEAPFGPGPVAGLKHMLAYGERDGFTVKMSTITLDTLNMVKATKR